MSDNMAFITFCLGVSVVTILVTAFVLYKHYHSEE